jgi:hypothetical protein
MGHHEEEDTPRAIRNADNSASPLLVWQRTRRFHERVAACPSGSSATTKQQEEHHQCRFVSWLPVELSVTQQA